MDRWITDRRPRLTHRMSSNEMLCKFLASALLGDRAHPYDLSRRRARRTDLWIDLERVERSWHRRCDPGRAHRLLHPRGSALLRRFRKRASLTSARLLANITAIN